MREELESTATLAINQTPLRIAVISRKSEQLSERSEFCERWKSLWYWSRSPKWLWVRADGTIHQTQKKPKQNKSQEEIEREIE